MDGKVQKYNEMKGYGWILVDFKTRLFFHVSNWKSKTAPVAGLGVTFDVAPSKSPNKAGQLPQAINIDVVEAATKAVQQ